jgi:hypothetical protein
MGIELTAKNGEEFDLSNIGWCYFLNIAEGYGWKPRNTQPPEGYASAESWPGNYDSSEGQMVTAEDASEFAAALEKMLQDPGRNIRLRELAQKMREALGIEVDPLFSDENETDEQFVEELIAFCNSGAFNIW